MSMDRPAAGGGATGGVAEIAPPKHEGGVRSGEETGCRGRLP